MNEGQAAVVLHWKGLKEREMPSPEKKMCDKRENLGSHGEKHVSSKTNATTAFYWILLLSSSSSHPLLRPYLPGGQPNPFWQRVVNLSLVSRIVSSFFFFFFNGTHNSFKAKTFPHTTWTLPNVKYSFSLTSCVVGEKRQTQQSTICRLKLNSKSFIQYTHTHTSTKLFEFSLSKSTRNTAEVVSLQLSWTRPLDWTRRRAPSCFFYFSSTHSYYPPLPFFEERRDDEKSKMKKIYDRAICLLMVDRFPCLFRCLVDGTATGLL